MSMQVSAAASIQVPQLPTVSRQSAPANSPLAVPFSERVGEKTFNGAVERINGEYVGSVSGLVGAQAEGSTVAKAEDQLENLVDFFA